MISNPSTMLCRRDFIQCECWHAFPILCSLRMRRTPSGRWLEEALTLFWWHLSFSSSMSQDSCSTRMPNILSVYLYVAQNLFSVPSYHSYIQKKLLLIRVISSLPLISPSYGQWRPISLLQSSVLCLGLHFEKERGALMSLLPLAGRTASRWRLTLNWKQKPTPVILAIQSTQRSDCFTASSSHVMTHWLMSWVFFLYSPWMTDTSKVERRRERPVPAPVKLEPLGAHVKAH